MINEKNRLYCAISSAKKISFRAHVRALSEEIKKRKSLRKCKKIQYVICEQLLEMKHEVRYLNLVRAYLRGMPYKKVERTTSEQNKISVSELTKLIKRSVSPFQENFHSESTVKAWIEKE